jgi:hypothetical protein
VKDIASNTSRGKAEFRRHNPVKITWSSEESGSKVHTASLFTLRQAPKKRMVSFMMMAREPNGMDYPQHNTPGQLVIQVSIDGSAHEHSWERLPKVGRFENWEQANSFAVRLEWEHPQGSGNWRFRYIQSGTLHTLIDANIPGSLKRYAQGNYISTLRFSMLRGISHPRGGIRRQPIMHESYRFRMTT